MILHKFESLMELKFSNSTESEASQVDAKTNLLEKLHKLLKNPTDLKQYRYFNEQRCVALEEIFKKNKKDDKVKECDKLWKSISTTRSKSWFKRLESLSLSIKKEKIEEVESKRLTLDFEVPTTKKQREDANKIAHDLAMKNKDKYSHDELIAMAKFTGFGGLGGRDNDEYYTPKELASASWNLLDAKEGDNILDPSCGTGIFSMTAPRGMTIQGVELNTTSGTIANALNPNTEVQKSSFEEFAVKNDEPIYDGIITNVPFGKRYDAYKGKDSKYKHLNRSEDYFMIRSLDLLKGGKRAVFLTTSASAQRPHKKDIRLELLKKASFVGGYRLPSIMFKESGTDQVVDILVFEKHPDEYLTQIEDKNYEDGNLEDAIDLSHSNSDFLNGVYFNKRTDLVLGDFLSHEEQVARVKSTGGSLHHHQTKDKVDTDLTLEEVKEILADKIKGKEFKNDFGYSELIPLVNNTLSKKELELQQTLKQRFLDEVMAISDGEPSLGDDDFVSLFEECEKAGMFTKRKTSNTPFLIKKIAMENPLKNGDYHTLLNLLLISLNGTNEDIEKYVENHKEQLSFYDKKSAMTSLKKSFSKYGLNANNILIALSMGRDEELKSLYEDNPLNVKQIDNLSIMGTPIYSLDSLTDEELKNENISICVDQDGKASAIDTFNAIKLYKGANYNQALQYIQNMPVPDGVSEELFAQKQKALMEKLSAYRKVGNIDTLAYSIDTINRYYPSQLKRRIMDRIDNISGGDIERVFKEKVESNISKNIELIDSMQIDKESILNNVSKSLYKEFLDNKLYDEPLRLMPYMDFYDAKESKNEIAVVRGIYSTSFNDVDSLLSYYIKEAIEGDKELYSHLENTLLARSTIDVKDRIDLDAGSQPVEELRGAITDELVEMARIYQNEDARDFARELKGTIAQDTGLGKSITMLMTSILALKTGRAKRILVLTPNSVVAKLQAEFEKFMTPEWKEKLSVLTSNDFMGDIKRIRSNKNIRIVIASHSIIPMFKLKNETLNKLTHIVSEDGSKEQTTQFYDLIGTYPYFSHAKAFFENLQFDAIFIDEQQNFKNGVASIGLRKASHIPSESHITLQYLCEYIRQSRGDFRGTVSVTATPFTNSPSEIIANLTLSGGHLDNRGEHLPDLWSHKSFVDAFIKEEEITTQKVNGIGMTSSPTFSGFKDFAKLKDIIDQSVKFRDAESEQARVKGLKVKPDYDILASKEVPNADIAQTFKNLSALNETFKVSKSEREKLSNLSQEEMRDDIKMTLQKTIGETFGFINKVRNLSNGTNFANGMTAIIIKDGTTLNDIEKALKGAKHFVFGMYKDKNKLSFEALQDLEVRHDARAYVYHGGTDEEKAREQDVTNAVRDLAPDFIIKKDGKTFFNAYTIDDGDINSITNKLIKAGICEEGNLYNIEHYPKYKTLISNMRDEYERKPVSKQIVFSDMPILTQRIIGQVINNAIKNGEFPPLAIHYFNKQMGGLKADKSNAIDIQDKFNDSSDPDVMIYGIAGITGVDFNKNVSAVHLMNIPNTPDIHHQAMGRAVRQGNDMEKVHVYKYFTSGTFDTFLDKLVSGKSDWIESLKGSEDVPDEIKLDTSSASQIMSNAMNMFGGQGYTHEEAIEKYMEYQKNEIIKEHAEINSIKIKTNIEKIDKLLEKKLLLENSPVDNTARVVASNISRFSDYAFKFRFAVFPNDLSQTYTIREEIVKNAKSIEDIYGVVKKYFDESQEKLIKQTQSHLVSLFEKDAENAEELSKDRKELSEIKRKLKLKKTSEQDRNLLNAKKTQLETFIEKLSQKQSVARVYASEIMQKDGGQVYYPSSTTEDELMESIKNVLSKEYQGLLIDIKNYLDELIEIDDRIQTQIVRVLSKKGDNDYNGNATVTFKRRLLTIHEAMEVIESL